jgi:hypothetical protein
MKIHSSARDDYRKAPATPQRKAGFIVNAGSSAGEKSPAEPSQPHRPDTGNFPTNAYAGVNQIFNNRLPHLPVAE